MIRLYEEKEEDFSHDGIGILSNCIRCPVKRLLNNLWDLELEYPLHDRKNLYLELKEHRIIKAPTPSGEQLFRIQIVEKDLDKIYVYATHIVFDSASNLVPDTNIVGKTRLEAVQQILANTLNSHKFNVKGDTTTFQTNARIVRKSPIDAIFSDDDNSVINRWGGEFDFDNFDIIVKDEIGVDSGEVIKYRKNLLGIKETIKSLGETCTRIVPQGLNTSQLPLLLPEYCLDSPLVGVYYQPLIKHMEFPDIRVKDTDESGPAVTEAEALEQLRNVCNKLFSEKHIDEPFFNYEINYIYLGDTEEYKQFKALGKLNIGDKVKIETDALNIALNGRIISYVYDALRETYESLEIGKVKKDVAIIIQQTVAQVKFERQKIEMEVKSLDENMAAKLEITEQGINQNIKNVKEGLETQITEQAGLIKEKVSNKDLSLEIQKRPTDIQIGFNAISSNVKNESGMFTINNCAFRIYNNRKNLMFSVGDDGHTYLQGKLQVSCESGISQYGGNGELLIDASKGGSVNLTPFGLVHETFIPTALKFLSNSGEFHFKTMDNANYGTIRCWNLQAGGTKNCIVQTKNYGVLGINAYETADYYFGDIGTGYLNKDGECVVWIDSKFQECVNTDITYHVFTQVYNGSITSIERYPNYFIVKGKESTEFSWEVKAKRKNYENVRLLDINREEILNNTYNEPIKIENEAEKINENLESVEEDFLNE